MQPRLQIFFFDFYSKKQIKNIERLLPLHSDKGKKLFIRYMIGGGTSMVNNDQTSWMPIFVANFE
jgi:hypothetical protein